MIMRILAGMILPFLFMFPAQAEPKADTATAMAEAVAAEHPGFAVSVSHQGKTVFERAWGQAQLQPPRPATPETAFNIYSTAKPLTGMAFLKLVHEQRVNLDDTVGQLAPTIPERFHPITLGQLLTHTSGIRHYKGRQDWIAFAERQCATPMEAVAYFADDPLAHDPGTQELYTTFGFALLSQVLLTVTAADDFAQVINDNLGAETAFHLDGDSDKAAMYHRDGESFAPVTGLNARCKFGGGGLIGSARDLMRAGQALYGGTIVPLDALPALLAPTTTTDGSAVARAFGMGVGAFERNGETIHYALHGGGAPGGRSYLLVFLEPQVAVGIAANFEGPDVSQLAIDLAMLFAGIERTD